MPHNGKKNKPNTSSRIERSIANVHASMAMEGLKPSKVCIALGKQYLEGKIRGQEAIAKVKAMHLVNLRTPND